jgi:hypothetical protein
VQYASDGALWVSISGGVRRVVANGTISLAPMTISSTVNTGDFELVGNDVIAADFNTGLVRSRIDGAATLFAGGLRSSYSVAWTPSGLPAVLDSTSNAVLTLENGSMRQVHGRVPLARNLAFEPQGAAFTSGVNSNATHFMSGQLQTLKVSALIHDQTFSGLYAASDTNAYVMGYGYNYSTNRYESTLYKITTTKPSRPVNVGEVVYTKSVPFTGLRPADGVLEIDFGTWKPPYAGDLQQQSAH